MIASFSPESDRLVLVNQSTGDDKVKHYAQFKETL